MAARGLPALGPTLFVQIAQAHQRAGHDRGRPAQLRAGQARRPGVGPKNLDEPERQAYFATVKLLGEDAMSRGDLDAAIENYRLYSESRRSGLETLRTLADLYERKGDPLAAAARHRSGAAVQRQGQGSAGTQGSLLLFGDARGPAPPSGAVTDRVRRRLLSAQGADDPRRPARRRRMAGRGASPDAAGAGGQAGQPAAKLLLARVLLRSASATRRWRCWRRSAARKPEKFASGEDEDAWYLAASCWAICTWSWAGPTWRWRA